MHGLHRVGYSHGEDYQGWNYAPVNQIKNIDYITSSSIHWHIKNEHLYAVNKIQEIDHVKGICLEFDSSTDLQLTQALNVLARKLSANKSIDKLLIRDKSSVVNFPVADSLVNVLRALTTRTCPLIRLDIMGVFSPSLHGSLIELIATQTSIRSLTLKLTNFPRETFTAVMKALMRNNESLRRLLFGAVSDYNSEIPQLSVDIIRKFKVKRFQCILPAGIPASEYESQFNALKDEGYEVSDMGYPSVYVTQPRQYTRPCAPKPEIPKIVNDEHQTNAIAALPTDMLYLILKGLDVKSLLSFKWVDKKIQAWMLTSTFWRDYYLSKASTISTELLTAADLIYGSFIAQNRRSNFWECINIAFAGTLLRNSLQYHSLNQFHEECVQKLLQSYPELRMMCWTFDRFSVNGGRSNGWWYKKWAPRRLSFYILGSSTVIYHLNIDMRRPDVVGVRFLQGEVTRDQEETDPTPRAIFDSFTSSSIDEIVARVKPMVESMIVSMRSGLSYVYRNLILDKVIDCKALPLIHEECAKSIASTFDSHANALMNQLKLARSDFDALKDLVEQFSKHVSSVPVEHVTTEYALLHHHVDRTAYTRLYKVRFQDGTEPWWNFEESTCFPRTKDRKLHQQTKKGERFKKTPQVALICLFRKVLNLVMMPVLKALWLRNLNDPHVEWYDFDKISFSEDPYRRTPLMDWYDYYWAKYQTLSSVTVSHASPSSWPMSAIAVGSRIAPVICEAVSAVVTDKWCGSNTSAEKFEDLIRTVEQYDVFSAKDAIELIRKALQ